MASQLVHDALSMLKSPQVGQMNSIMAGISVRWCGCDAGCSAALRRLYPALAGIETRFQVNSRRGDVLRWWAG
jgi:hypothetical protein